MRRWAHGYLEKVPLFHPVQGFIMQIDPCCSMGPKESGQDVREKTEAGKLSITDKDFFSHAK
jgi:hypothetical protein